MAGNAARQKRRVLLVGVAGLSLLLLSSGVVLHVKKTGGSTDPVAVIAMFVGLAALIVAAWQLILTIPPPLAASLTAAQQLENAATKLADSLIVQWEREADLRSLRMPSPLQVPWATTRRPVAVPRKEILRSEDKRTLSTLKGRLDEAAQLFNELPRHQLVILGDPGAGKSALAILLTLELLKRRKPADPVPLLLPLLSWDPTSTKLEDWISYRLGTDYPFLRESELFAADAPERLVVGGKIIAVLDGLDEMPTEARRLALGEMSRALADKPLILTCRTAEFEQAVLDGRPVAGAAVVELKPVPATDCLAYLREGEDAAGRQRWNNVARLLREGRDRPLIEALSTPLMISMARVVYYDENPDEILDRNRFPDRGAIETRLLDAYLPIAYGITSSHAANIVAGTPARGPWGKDEAQRWLTFIARELNRRRTRDIAWWEIYRSVPSKAANIAFVIHIAILGFILAASLGSIVLAPSHSVSLTLLESTLAGFVVAIVAGFTALMPAFYGSIPDLPVEFMVRRGFGGYSGTRKEAARFFVAGALAPAVFVGSLTSVTIDPILGAIAAGVSGVVGALLVGTVRWSRRTAWTTAPTPGSVLMADRRTTLVHWAGSGSVAGLAVSLIVGRHHGVVAALSMGLLTATIGGWCVTSGTAYAWFLATRLWLSVNHKLPLRTMAFFEDAHQRGVLRQFGAVYQFRHGRLQDHLARGTPGDDL